MKTIGVLGGLGPQATLDFESRVHAVSQKLIPQQGNSGYPPMVIVYLRHPPILLNEDLTPILPFQPDPRLLEAARKLGKWSDFLVITANAPHILQGAIEQASGRKILSMITVTLEEVQRRQMSRVGVLGFGEPLVYQIPLNQLGISHETLWAETTADPLRFPLDEAIRAVWEGREGPQDRQVARDAVAALRAREVDGIILGCTEIPLLLEDHLDEPDLINPTALLAEAAVRHAIE